MPLAVGPMVATVSRKNNYSPGDTKTCVSIVLGLLFLSAVAGWSSLAARRAHNPKVVGSNPTPATTDYKKGPFKGAFLLPRGALLSVMQ